MPKYKIANETDDGKFVIKTIEQVKDEDDNDVNVVVRTEVVEIDKVEKQVAVLEGQIDKLQDQKKEVASLLRKMKKQDK
jgi:predicted transcriptional regulator